MRVCLMIEGQEGVTWDQWRGLATTAEEAGFEALFRSDHYQSLGGGPNVGSSGAMAGGYSDRRADGQAAASSMARGGGSRRETTFETPLPAIDTP